MSDINLDIEQQTISNFIKDTWKKDCLTGIHIHLFRNWGWQSSIEFKNGLTSSVQHFKNEDFNTLSYEMKTFLETIN